MNFPNNFHIIVFVYVSEQRHLADTQMRLDDNSNVQKQLNEAAFHAEMDLKTKMMQNNIEVSDMFRIS